MVNLRYRIIILFTASFFLAAGIVLCTKAAEADHDAVNLYKITDIGETSVVLPIRYGDFRGEKAVAKITIKNDDMDTVKFKEMNIVLDEDGRANITVSGLNSETDYRFKVTVREMDDDFVNTSDERDATTI